MDHAPTDPSFTLLDAFTPPFTKAAMLAELYDALWGWARGLSLNLGEEAVFGMLAGANPPITRADLCDFDYGAADMPGFIEIVQGWDVVQAVGDLYDFGMLGIERADMEAFDPESIYTRASAFLLDLMQSRVQAEIGTFGEAFYPRMALTAAQTAAARGVLEEYEFFYEFAGQGCVEGKLTVRDLALVAKMDEADVQQALNLDLSCDGQGRPSRDEGFIEPRFAKAWLQARGRYLPITVRYGRAETDLREQGFRDTLEAWEYIEERYESLHMTDVEFNRAVGAEFEIDPDDPRASLPHSRMSFGCASARDAALMARFAKVLQVDAALFRMRMQEAATREELELVRMELRSWRKAA